LSISSKSFRNFEEALRISGGTQSEFARRLHPPVSPALISRYCSGVRRPSTRAFQLLANLLSIDPLELIAAHGEWARNREQRRPTVTLELPEGMTPSDAKRIARDALTKALAAARAEGAR
jgi:transcriptional regulator with XRE-family HTH domain